MLNPRLASLFLTTVLMCSAVPASAQDDVDDAGAMLVLDASGSMWGKVGDQHKIEIARDVVGKTVSEWDTKTELGLIAYGHNRKGDCDDIETLIAPGGVSADNFNAKTKALNPTGKTPMTAAVLKAAEALKYRESKATVILISDGKETCDLDPCEIGRKLEETGVDFTAHIIGFDVPEEDTAGLQCLANTTGGMFIEAKNPGDLMEAMNDAREITTHTDAPVLDEATLKVPNEVPAGSKFKVEWDGPKNRKDQLVIRSEDRKQRYDVEWIAVDDYSSPTEMKAPEMPGTYTVFYEIEGGTSLGQTTLYVVPVTASLSAPDEVNAGSAFKVQWTGPSNPGDKIQTFNTETNKWMDEEFASSSPVKLRAPETPGIYKIRYVTPKRNTLGEIEFTVISVSAKIDAPGPQPAGSRFTVEWTGPENFGDNIRIYNKQTQKRYDSSFAAEGYHPAKLKAPEEAGIYEIRYESRNKKTLHSVEFEVTPVTANINSPGSVAPKTKFSFDWTGPMNSRDRIAIFDQAGKRYKYGYAYEKHQPMTLLSPENSEQYELRYMTEGKKVLATVTFEVK